MVPLIEAHDQSPQSYPDVFALRYLACVFSVSNSFKAFQFYSLQFQLAQKYPSFVFPPQINQMRIGPSLFECDINKTICVTFQNLATSCARSLR